MIGFFPNFHKGTRKLRRNVFLGLLCVLICLAACPPEAIPGQDGTSPTRLAVLYFDNNSITDRERLEPFRKGLAETLISDLSKIEALQIVERTRIDALLSELRLHQTGAVDSASAQRVGRILGVQTLLLGSFTALDSMLRIDARIVDVESGLIIQANEVSGNTDDFFELEESLVRKIAAGLHVKSAGGNRGVASGDTRASFQAVRAYSEGLDLMDKGRLREAAAAFSRALEFNPGYPDAARMLKKTGVTGENG